MSTRAGLIVTDSKGIKQGYYKHNGHPDEMAEDVKEMVSKLPASFTIADFEKVWKNYCIKTNCANQFERIPEKDESQIYRNQDVQLVYIIGKNRTVKVDGYRKTARGGWIEN